MKAVTPLHHLVIGMATEFRSKKFRGIDSEWFPLFRGRKYSFRGIPSSAEEPVPKIGTEWIGILRKNEFLWNLHSLSDHYDSLYILL
jgi:hypothetical protein